eukprot:scaffold34652_cov211-Amphora_coffeaeformis.AAC.8
MVQSRRSAHIDSRSVCLRKTFPSLLFLCRSIRHRVFGLDESIYNTTYDVFQKAVATLADHRTCRIDTLTAFALIAMMGRCKLRWLVEQTMNIEKAEVTICGSSLCLLSFQ